MGNDYATHRYDDFGGITSKSGVFQYVAIKATKGAQGNPIKILISLSLLTALGSAFLDNVTTVLLVVQLLTYYAHTASKSLIYFLKLFFKYWRNSNISGDPPNIMIGSANKHLDFNAFLLNLAPIVIIIVQLQQQYFTLCTVNN